MDGNGLDQPTPLPADGGRGLGTANKIEPPVKTLDLNKCGPVVIPHRRRPQFTEAAMTDRDVLPEDLFETLLQQAVLLTLHSHGYTAVDTQALSLVIEVVEKRM